MTCQEWHVSDVKIYMSKVTHGLWYIREWQVKVDTSQAWQVKNDEYRVTYRKLSVKSEMARVTNKEWEIKNDMLRVRCWDCYVKSGKSRVTNQYWHVKNDMLRVTK